MNNFIKCKEGNVFTLAEKGKEIAKVRTKYEPDNRNYKIYIHNVPKSWIDNGYVVEVSVDDQMVRV